MKRVTQEDIAKKAGVHRGTVSRTLSNHPGIPASTRERILRIAEELGYRPDPMLASLAAYRSSNRKSGYHGVLAWLVIYTDLKQFKWFRSKTFSLYHEGAKAQADKYGYQLEIFEFDQKKYTTKRMASILRARNVKGILLCPQSLPSTTIDFAWEDFSLITFGYTLSKPELHTVTATQYRAMQYTMKMMHERGYRKIAFVFDPKHDERADNNYLSAYLSAQHKIGEAPIIYSYHVEAPEGLPAFLKEQRTEGNIIEALVVGDHLIMRKCPSIGLRLPEDYPAACPLLTDRDGKLSGVYEDSLHIGEVAVDLLTNMIMRGERGVPTKVRRVHIEGVWIEGETLPPKS
ncbi:MAG: LacI family DNA-binding transcriptional regulator [Puniceicoccales bacterium]